MHISVTKCCIVGYLSDALWDHMCIFLLQNVALWDICLMHCGLCEMGL